MMDTELELAEEAFRQARQDEIGYADYEEAPFLAYVDNNYHRPTKDDYFEAYGTFHDAYRGEWESFRDYSDDYVDSTGMLSGVDDTVARYFDYDAFARDLEYDHWTAPSADGIGIYVFLNI